MDYRGLPSVSNGSSGSKTDEGVNSPSTSGDEGRADTKKNIQVFTRHDERFTQDDSSKSGSDQQKRSITDTEGFTSSTKSSNDEKSSNDDKSSSGGDKSSRGGEKSTTNGEKSSSDSDRSNEYNDGNNASASSSDSESNSDEKHHKKPKSSHRKLPSDPQARLAPAQPQGQEVIDLLDSEISEDPDADAEKTDAPHEKQRIHQAKKQRTGDTLNFTGQGLGSAQLAQNIEQIYQAGGTSRGLPIQPGSSIPEVAAMPNAAQSTGPPMYQVNQVEKPVYLNLNSANLPTWRTLVPAPRKPPPNPARPNQRKFRLTLLNVNEFTITGLPTYLDGPPTPLTNLRTAIRQISRDHGKAVYDRDKELGGGKWRIPLAAYHPFVGFLRSDPNTYIDGIPQHQLQIASLEKARQEKGFPTVEEVIDMGVPTKLARALAPFQRGGVDFVCEKEGRALIADDMGLGKVRGTK